jgi:hypothetical protein
MLHWIAVSGSEFCIGNKFIFWQIKFFFGMLFQYDMNSIIIYCILIL